MKGKRTNEPANCVRVATTKNNFTYAGKNLSGKTNDDSVYTPSENIISHSGASEHVLSDCDNQFLSLILL